MRNIGELKWADQEEDPVEVPPCDIRQIIKDLELRTRMGLYGKSMKRADVQHAPEHSTSAEKTKQSPTTLFDPCNYSPPWLLVPFSALSHNLQKRIPFHLLPQKLIFHDPWNLLSVQDIVEVDSGSSDGSSTVNGHNGNDTDWTAKDDIIWTYNLQLSTAGREKVKMERESHAELDRKNSRQESFLHWPHSEISGPVEPASNHGLPSTPFTSSKIGPRSSSIPLACSSVWHRKPLCRI